MINKITNLFFAILALSSSYSSQVMAKTVHYQLTATRGEVNLSGKQKVDFALMLNGTIPAPTLEFTEGDDAEIVVNNRIPGEELSIHWHGILLPPEMDGVPYVNTPPIPSGESFTFKFRLRQHGTYWYHSHTNVQEQKGLYGALVIYPKQRKIKVDREVVAVISDWSDENATDILKNLRKDGDYYQYPKKTIRSWWGAFKAGALNTFIENEWIRMGGMDYSDVAYDAFLINGKKNVQLSEAHPGEKIRLRIINAAASTYFHVSLGQTALQVIAADGIDIEPIWAKQILIAMAETYDVLFTVPEHKNYELKITAQDGTGSASGWIGMGSHVAAPNIPQPDLYAPMNHEAGEHTEHLNKIENENHEDHGNEDDEDEEDEEDSENEEEDEDHSEHLVKDQHTHVEENHTEHNEHSGHNETHAHTNTASTSDHNQHLVKENEQDQIRNSVNVLTVDELRANAPTAFALPHKTYDLKLVLDGDMKRYIWHINGKAIHEERTLEVNEGDVVSFTFVNKTMMHHPLHLHGHFFRVLNKNGEYSPLKHTVDVPPHGTRKIEFLANEPGEWMLHCHNLYHLKTGMGRVVKYLGYKTKPEIQDHQKHDPHLHDHWYTYGNAEIASNHAQAFFRASQTWNQWETRFETRNSTKKSFSFNEPWEVEGDIFYRRWSNRFLNLVGGITYFNKSPRAVLGISYLLPLLFESQILADNKGQVRFDLKKHFQWTSQFFTELEITWRPDQLGEIEQPLEMEITLMYSPQWAWAAGLMLTEDTLGGGLQVQF